MTTYEHTSTRDSRTDIGIILSKTCLELNLNKLDWTCPRLANWWPDDTISRWSGELIWSGLDMYREQKPIPKYTYAGYDYVNSTGLRFIDPPPTHYQYMQLIIIAPHVPEYELVLAGKPHLRHGFAVERCEHGIIAGPLAHNVTLVDEFIQYMREGCGGDFLDPYTKPQDFGKRPYDVLDSPGWIYEQWVKAVEELCKGKC